MTKKLYIDTVMQTQVQPIVFELLYFKERGEYEVNYNNGEFAIGFDVNSFHKAMNFMLDAVSGS